MDSTRTSLHHQLKHHSSDVHMVTWRSPDAVLNSAANLLPNLDGSTLIERLIYAYAAALIIMAEVGAARFVPHGSVTPEMIAMMRRDMSLNTPVRPLQLFSANGRHDYPRPFQAPSIIDGMRLDLLREIDRAVMQSAVHDLRVVSLPPATARQLAGDLKRSVGFSMGL